MSVLECRSVSRSFGGVRAVHEVDLLVQPGRIVGVVGPNGAGKSTLFKLLAGEEGPDAGTIRLDGRTVTGWWPDSAARSGVGRTFQDVHVHDALTVLENVAVYQPRGHSGFGLLKDLCRPARRTLDLAGARAALGRVDLLDREDVLAGELPFGAQRLLSVARVIAADAPVVLLDEPMAGLSSDEVSRLAQLVQELAAEGRAVALIDHNFEAMAGLCDELVVMHNGAVLTRGKPTGVVQDPEVLRIYVGQGE